MRVIGGERRGLKLNAPKDEAVRPTADKVKGAIFNTIQWELAAAEVFVDCFGGSGAMAIEALSRGVKTAWIFDTAPASIDLIRSNLRKARYENRAHCLKTAARSGLDVLAAKGVAADLIFMDPPYAMAAASARLCEAIAAKKILKSTGIIMIEHEKSVIMPITISTLKRYKQKRYGITVVDYYRWEAADDNRGLSREL
jgi:16S rRNA (guanine966-N2)-methyltransferase